MATTDPLDEFRRLNSPRLSPCKIGTALASLNGEATALQAALDADKSDISAGSIVKWLERRGHKASTPAVVSHRDGSCQCGRDV